MPDLRVFQGRADQCSDLNAWLADPDISMMGIRGEGGIGKSTLMAKVFAESQGFAGKFWADVRTGTPIAALAERSLQEFGVLPEQVRSLQEKDLMLRLLRQLQQGRYLLAIDNLESVLTATGDWQGGYEEFLDGFQSLGSKSVLLLAGREYPPKYFGWRQSRWLTLEDGLAPNEGAALLERLDVADTIENRATVSEQVQGNPLALSLIAGWLRDEYRQPEERLMCHLSQHTDLFQLAGKHRGEANISVDRVLQWSVDRLTSAQQDLLTQVSVLRGAFDAELATALVLEAPVSDADLYDLERRSLLQELPKPSQDAPRLFQLQPRIREFVQKQGHDLTLVHERAIAYFWSHRQTEFARDDTQAAVSHYEETFYHQCKLGHYAAAAETVGACTEFLHRRGYYQLLVNLYSQLHTNWQPSPDQQQDYAGVCNNLGSNHRALGQYQQAIDFYQQSLAITCKIGEACGTSIALSNDEADSLGNLGNVYQFLGQYQQAIDFYQQSLAIKREIVEACGTSIAIHHSEAASLTGLGGAYFFLGQYQQAIDFHQQSLEIAREIGDHNTEGGSLCNLGHAYNSLGQYQQAIKLYQQSLKVQRSVGNRDFESNCLSGLGNAYQSLGQYQKAIDFHQQSLAITQDIGTCNGEANSLMNLGNAYQSLGKYQKAIDFYHQSLVITRDIGDRYGEANSLNGLGNAYKFLGKYQKAIDFHQQSLAITQDIGNRKGEASSLNGLGNTYQSLRKYQQAIEFYQQSLAINREIGDRKGETASLFNMGNAYQSLGKYQQAIEFYQQSLAIDREIGDRHGEATSLGNLGNAYGALGQYDQAIAFQQQSLAIKREIGDRNGEGGSFYNLGNAYRALGQYQQAIKLYQQSLAIKREIGDRNGEALLLWNLNFAYQQQGKIPKSREYKIAALRVWKALELPIDAAPLPEISKRIFKASEQPDGDWAELIIQSFEQLGWLMDILAGVGFLVSFPVRLFQRFKKSWLFWFAVGLAIALLIWWLQQ